MGQFKPSVIFYTTPFLSLKITTIMTMLKKELSSGPLTTLQSSFPASHVMSSWLFFMDVVVTTSNKSTNATPTNTELISIFTYFGETWIEIAERRS